MFNVGDKVRYIGHIYSPLAGDDTGTVVQRYMEFERDDIAFPYDVEFGPFEVNGDIRSTTLPCDQNELEAE